MVALRDAALSVSGLEKRYGRTQALGGVDLDVAQGELVGLLGPNGAGKSTLVKIACGLVRASRGSARICGAPAGSAEARRALGYLAELFRFPGWVSADELLELHQRLAGSHGGPPERAELLELVGLADARRTRISAMSKGMQQRLGIAQALVGSPRLLLLDEPTSALDPAGRRTVRRLLEELRRRGIAVLLNSHLLSEVELVCDRVAIISKGRLARSRHAGRARSCRRCRDRDGRWYAALPGRASRRRAASCRRARRRRRVDLRRPCAHEHARGDLPRRCRGRALSELVTIAGYGLRESLRRRMFAVVVFLTACFLGLYAFGTHQAFKDTSGFVTPDQLELDTRVVAGAIVFGLAMFATLFLGAVLAVFLTLGIVRNDAEQGLLQPLVVRPVGRTRLLIARFLGSSAVCVVYVLAVYFATVAITDWAGDWTPDRVVAPGLELAAGVVLVAAISTLGSVFLTATANGIGVLMIFGAGLVAGLLGQIGEAINSDRLSRIAEISSWVVPFEALYQDGLNRLTSDTYGFTRFALQLGPFGGSQPASGLLFPWAALYLVAIAGLAAFAFSRRDL